LTDGNGLISGAEVVDKYLMIYYSDSMIQQWDLDTGEIVREIKPLRSSTASFQCAWHFDSLMVFCSLANGFVRKVNMMTAKIEIEFVAHGGYSFLLLNGTYLYTAGYDGLVNKFDLFGNLLNTFEITLGYANILACEGEHIFVNYYNIELDRKVRIVRWNHITGIPEEFPVPMSTILDPASASRDYYFAVSLGPLGFGYAQFFKSNLSLVRAELKGDSGYWGLKFPSNGRRFFFPSNNTISELFLSNEGLTRGESIYLKYTTPTISNFVVLNETTIIAVFSSPSNLQYTSRFIDSSSGVFSKVVDTFAGHSRFLVSEEILYAAVGKEIVAYHMANLSLAWRSPALSPQNINYFEVKDGFIYFTCANYAGWYNATTFEKIGLIVIQEYFHGNPAFSNGILYVFYTANSVHAIDLTDGSILRRYSGMSNVVYYVLIHADYLYVANADTFIYKFDFEREVPLLSFVGHTSDVNVILIRGQIMYSGSKDQTIRKWNIDTSESLFIYYGHTEGVNRLHIYNQKLFSVTPREVRIWDLNRDRLFKTLSDRSVNIISLRNSGNNLLTCTIDGTISSWNVDEGYKVMDVVQGEDGKFVVGAQWQNSSLFIAKNDGTIFHLNPDEDSVAILVSSPLVEIPVEINYYLLNDVDYLILYYCVMGTVSDRLILLVDTVVQSR
jgi:WD40 repeat protein